MGLTLDDLDDEVQAKLRHLESALENLTERESLLELREDEAQKTLDMLQLLADFPTPSCSRSRVLKMMFRLSKKSGYPPRCLIIRNIKRLGDRPFGGGGFGDIWKGEIGSSESDRIACAIKVVRCFRSLDGEEEYEDAVKTYVREAILWRQLKHPNVLPFLGIYYLDDSMKDICLVSPFMAKGNLHQFLKKSRPEQVDGHTLMYDITLGMEYLHKEDIVHGDLKDLNILVREDCRACICDFGLSRLTVTYGLGPTMSCGGVTPGPYMAPEFLLGHLSSKESDVYAFGTLCYGILRGMHDLPNLAAVSRGRSLPPQRPANLPEDAACIWSVLHECWQQEPSDRPTATDIVLRIIPQNGQIAAAPHWDESLYTTMRNNVDLHPLYASQPASQNYSRTTEADAVIHPTPPLVVKPLEPFGGTNVPSHSSLNDTTGDSSRMPTLETSPNKTNGTTTISNTMMKVIRSRLQTRHEELQFNFPTGPTPLKDITEETKKPKKKALLIGVEYTTLGENALKGPHKDIAAMRKLLIEKYQYHPKDIVILVDTKDTKSQKQPTHDNMMTEMQNLVHGAAAGDRFFFHYSGHAIQVPSQDDMKEDGMDECIVPCDSNGSPNDTNLIKDNVLRKTLVDTLPTGSHLVAIFDGCHSASLLDLEHFRCNRVYVPWISKGRRKSDSMWLATIRKNAGLVNTRTIHQTSHMSNDIMKTRKTSVDLIYNIPNQSVPPTPASPTGSPQSESTSVSPRSQLLVPEIVTQGISVTSLSEDEHKSTRGSMCSIQSSYTPWFTDQDERFCESPVEEYCTGECRRLMSGISLLSGAPADVKSLSSYNYEQTTWEYFEGPSMTQTLINILSSDPHPTLKDFMTHLSYTMHGGLLKMHEANKEFKKNRKSWILNKIGKVVPVGYPKRVKISNFQEAQLSSLEPLDMDSRLVL